VIVLVHLKGSSTSGWYAPPKGTHSQEKHVSVGSGKSGVAYSVHRKKRSIPEIRVDAIDSAREYVLDAASGTDLDYGMRVYGNAVSDNPVSIRADDALAEVILDSGRFKNQYEVGTSSGEYDPEGRKSAETSVFDIKSDDPIAFPVYGYVADGIQRQYGPEQYGQVEFQLKKSVRSRTTVTLGDSFEDFGSDLAPSPIDDLGIESLGYNWRYAVANNLANVEYIEAQIHGGVSVSDVANIVVHRSGKPRTYYSAVAAAAKRRGIPIEYVSGN
jgi:hypothetical protein